MPSPSSWKEPFASLVKAIEMSPGTRDAKSFEPFESISDWLINDTDNDWLFTKTDASMIGFVPKYQL